MRQLLFAPALAAALVTAGPTAAMASTDAAAPIVATVDASLAPAPLPDAGVFDAAPSSDALPAPVPAPTPAPAPTKEIDDWQTWFARGLEAIKGGNLARDVAALVLIAFGLLARTFEDRLPGIFKGGTGKLLLVTALAAAGALGHGLLAGHSLSDKALWGAMLAVLAEAVLTYEVGKRAVRKLAGAE